MHIEPGLWLVVDPGIPVTHPSAESNSAALHWCSIFLTLCNLVGDGIGTPCLLASCRNVRSMFLSLSNTYLRKLKLFSQHLTEATSHKKRLSFCKQGSCGYLP